MTEEWGGILKKNVRNNNNNKNNLKFLLAQKQIGNSGSNTRICFADRVVQTTVEGTIDCRL